MDTAIIEDKDEKTYGLLLSVMNVLEALGITYDTAEMMAIVRGAGFACLDVSLAIVLEEVLNDRHMAILAARAKNSRWE